MKKIHILLTRKQWQELKDLKKELKVNCIVKEEGTLLDTYEEYLEKEEKKPTMALFG